MVTRGLNNGLTDSAVGMAKVGRVIEIDEATRQDQGAALLGLTPGCLNPLDRGGLQESVSVFNLYGSSIPPFQCLGHGGEGLQLPPAGLGGAGT